MKSTLACPLCEAKEADNFHRDRRRAYLRCRSCALVFVPPEYHLDRAAELAEYQLHENAVDDAGYRKFLSRLSDPLGTRLAPGARGLDFGCGPGPALAAMLVEQGFQVDLYDSFFQPDRAVFERSYDFIVATEVVEHLYQPGRELQQLWGLLRPGGWFGFMTKLVISEEAFATWHYKNDPTHVCFFSRKSWQWWADKQGCSVEFVGPDVILLQRREA